MKQADIARELIQIELIYKAKQLLKEQKNQQLQKNKILKENYKNYLLSELDLHEAPRNKNVVAAPAVAGGTTVSSGTQSTSGTVTINSQISLSFEGLDIEGFLKNVESEINSLVDNDDDKKLLEDFEKEFSKFKDTGFNSSLCCSSFLKILRLNDDNSKLTGDDILKITKNIKGYLFQYDDVNSVINAINANFTSSDDNIRKIYSSLYFFCPSMSARSTPGKGEVLTCLLFKKAESGGNTGNDILLPGNNFLEIKQTSLSDRKINIPLSAFSKKMSIQGISDALNANFLQISSAIKKYNISMKRELRGENKKLILSFIETDKKGKDGNSSGKTQTEKIRYMTTKIVEKEESGDYDENDNIAMKYIMINPFSYKSNGFNAISTYGSVFARCLNFLLNKNKSDYFQGIKDTVEYKHAFPEGKNDEIGKIQEMIVEKISDLKLASETDLAMIITILGLLDSIIENDYTLEKRGFDKQGHPKVSPILKKTIGEMNPEYIPDVKSVSYQIANRNVSLDSIVKEYNYNKNQGKIFPILKHITLQQDILEKGSLYESIQSFITNLNIQNIYKDSSFTETHKKNVIKVLSNFKKKLDEYDTKERNSTKNIKYCFNPEKDEKLINIFEPIVNLYDKYYFINEKDPLSDSYYPNISLNSFAVSDFDDVNNLMNYTIDKASALYNTKNTQITIETPKDTYYMYTDDHDAKNRNLFGKIAQYQASDSADLTGFTIKNIKIGKKVKDDYEEQKLNNYLKFQENKKHKKKLIKENTTYISDTSKLQYLSYIEAYENLLKILITLECKLADYYNNKLLCFIEDKTHKPEDTLVQNKTYKTQCVLFTKEKVIDNLKKNKSILRSFNAGNCVIDCLIFDEKNSTGDFNIWTTDNRKSGGASYIIDSTYAQCVKFKEFKINKNFYDAKNKSTPNYKIKGKYDTGKVLEFDQSNNPPDETAIKDFIISDYQKMIEDIIRAK